MGCTVSPKRKQEKPDSVENENAAYNCFVIKKENLIQQGTPKEERKETESFIDFDIFIIGGGSGGLALAKEAAEYGAKIGLADYVKPSPKGTTWGLGGTCVNVGCIPKKLMHYAACAGEALLDNKEKGWEVPEKIHHDWVKMKENVSKHIKSLNWGYQKQLEKLGIQYFNKYASFIDPHTISLNDEANTRIRAKNIIIAVGNRPNYEGIPGAKELAISSDDLFWLEKSPGKILIVGGSYVALECAGFLANVGCDTTLMVRSIFLRGYDQEMAMMIGQNLAKHKVKILVETIPLELQKAEEGKIKVRYKNLKDSSENFEMFETVLLAIGRKPITEGLNLEAAGIKPEPNGKLRVNEKEQTSTPHIYAIGDVADGKPELTPVAIKTGRLLARRLMGKSEELMSYAYIPSTVYTPIEYGFCGLSEEEAISKIGKENLEVYRSYFQPLEWSSVAARKEDFCYSKLIVQKDTNIIVGFHYFGPNGGEVTQGYAIALSCKTTKQQWDESVGVYSTNASEMLSLKKISASVYS